MGWVPTAEKAVGLPWLRPSAAGLLALTDNPPNRTVILDCPGTVVHLLRYARPTPLAATLVLSPDSLSQPGLCKAAAEFVENDWPADWVPGAEQALLLGRTAARLASSLATESRLCSADAAWVASLLTPLGWYAMAPAANAVEAGRKLAFRWRLPTPFSVTIGSLALEPEDAAALGGHVGLHQVVQAAVYAAEQRLGAIGLTHQSYRPDKELDGFATKIAGQDLPATSTNPEPHPKLLAKLLKLCAAARQRTGHSVVCDLEAQIDALTHQLTGARAAFHRELQDAKLRSLAEFAAGAGHEINNPLAVVSGNAQLLLPGETNQDRRKRLEAIIRSTGRIHDILISTRQFARPPIPKPAPISCNDILRDCDSHRAMAEDFGIQLVTEFSEDVIAIFADPGQFRQILGNLIQNGIEAANRGGRVSIKARTEDDRVVIFVEDTGPGPAPASVPHLFDPFFSGRDAGRGRGLGLAQAWQLARQNGGEVRYAPTSGGPTRFVLTLPRFEPSTVRRSA